MPADLRPPDYKPLLGLALGSGAARGWAHMGVLRALEELGVEIDVFAGCSAGALVGASHLLGITDRVEDWAKTIGPVGAFSRFSVGIARGGFVNPDKAFDLFRDADKPIPDLPKPFGTVATDLATGKEVWLTNGSTLTACRASSAVPMVMQAASYTVGDTEHWLIDGATSNPVPVTLARALGAARVIAVDLNVTTMALSRFNRPDTREVVVVEPPKPSKQHSLTAPMEVFFKQQGQDIAQRFALAKAKSQSRPQFFETAIATMDIVQSQLAQARSRADAPDIRIAPDLSKANAAAFDQWEYFEEEGYKATMDKADSIRAIAS